MPGASEGAGLGNAFLSHINGVDGILHVVRCFEDEDILHHEGTVDPVRDLEIIYSEILAKDIQHTTKLIAELENKVKRRNAKEDKDELACIQKADEVLKSGLTILSKVEEWSGDEIYTLNKHLFLSSKPIC